MITQFCVAILVTFNVNVTLCHCTVTQVTQVIDFVARARFKSQVWLWLETRVMCRAPWKLVSRKLARYLLGSTNPHPCSPVAANGQWSHWNYCPLRCFELHVRRQIDTMCQTHQTSLVSEQVTPLSLYQYNIREGFKKKSLEISIRGGGSNPFHTFSSFFCFFLVNKRGV